jgi:zinc transporter ZupT
MDQTITVLLYASLAAASAGLGVVPLLGRRRLPVGWLGVASAVAGGLMLGAAYMLLTAALPLGGVPAAAGALLGTAFVALAHRAAGTQDLVLTRLDDTGAAYGYQVLLVNALHAAPEGVAIGAAMAVGVPFGVFLALALALHNIPEGSVLASILRSRGVSLPRAAGLVVAVNVNQILLALVTFALVSAERALLPWALGFATGALIHLVMADLLPESYERAGRTSIALVTIVAMAILVLLGVLGL